MSCSIDGGCKRGVLTAHFYSTIHLDYPCALATMDPSGKTSSNDIPYVANITQATLEIRKSRFFIEKHEAYIRERQQEASSSLLGKKRGKNPNNNLSKEEAAEAARETAILADPYAAITGAHFVLNALPQIGNTGRPLTLCHFIVNEGHLVTHDKDSRKGKSTHGADELLEEDKKVSKKEDHLIADLEKDSSLLAVIRLPIHMCSSVGQQGRNEGPKNAKKKKQKRVDLAEGGSCGLAGLEVVFVPTRNQGAQKDIPNRVDTVDSKPHPIVDSKAKNNKSMSTSGAGPKQFASSLFDVTVTIAGVQYTYLLTSQFDVLAGRN